MIRNVFVAAACVAIAACSTSPVNEKTAKQVPASRVYLSQQDSDASALFTRDSGLLGSGCPHDIYVNDARAFTINPGESIRLKLKPGSYIFRFESHVGLCPDITMTQASELKPGDEQEYRVLIPSDFSVRFIRIK